MNFYNMYTSLGKKQEALLRKNMGISIYSPLSEPELSLYEKMNELTDISISVERILHTEFRSFAKFFSQ